MKCLGLILTVISYVFVCLLVNAPHKVSGQTANNLVDPQDIFLPSKLITKVMKAFSKKPHCECKPIKECPGQPTDTLGTYLLEPRLGPRKCPNVMDVCCVVTCDRTGIVATHEQGIEFESGSAHSHENKDEHKHENNYGVEFGTGSAHSHENKDEHKHENNHGVEFESGSAHSHENKDEHKHENNYGVEFGTGSAHSHENKDEHKHENNHGVEFESGSAHSHENKDEHKHEHEDDHKTVHYCGTHTPGGTGGEQPSGAARSAGHGEFPWMAAIFSVEDDEKKFECGGSLIHSQVVMTAAHCVVYPDTDYLVRVGEYNPSATDETWVHQDRGVLYRIIHPHYYSGSLHNDIALIILDKPVDYKYHVQPICLPTQGEVVKTKQCFVTGWGTDPKGKSKIFSGLMESIKLSMVPHAECQDILQKTRLGWEFHLDKSFVCAGGDGADACKGDGGGPLVCRIPGQNRRYRQVGIVSWGVGCSKYPGVYTNVPLYVNWINSKLEEHNITYSGTFHLHEEDTFVALL